MKVCFIHSYGEKAFSKESVGGTELQLYYISRELAKEDDVEVSFLTRSEDDEIKVVENVELIPAVGNVESWTSKLWSGFKLLYRLNKVDADLYFSSSDNMIPGLVSLFCRLKGKKHVHRTVHKRECDGSLIRQEPVKGVVNNLGLRLADTIFVQCQDHKGLLSEWFDPNCKIIPNSFPIGQQDSQDGDYILWVGRRVEWKRPEMVLNLAEEFDSEKFVIVSPRTGSNEEFYDKIEEKAEELANVELIERVPRSEIQDYFNNAKIFLNTSEKEGFPNTFIEAGRGSTPILSYRVDPDGFIESNECGFSCGAEYDVLKRRLEEMLVDEEQRVQRGRNCRKYIEGKNDVSKNIREVKKEFRRLLDTEKPLKE